MQVWDKWPKCFSDQNVSAKVNEMFQRKEIQFEVTTVKVTTVGSHTRAGISTVRLKCVPTMASLQTAQLSCPCNRRVPNWWQKTPHGVNVVKRSIRRKSIPWATSSSERSCFQSGLLFSRHGSDNGLRRTQPARDLISRAYPTRDPLSAAISFRLIPWLACCCAARLYSIHPPRAELRPVATWAPIFDLWRQKETTSPEHACQHFRDYGQSYIIPSLFLRFVLILQYYV